MKPTLGPDLLRRAFGPAYGLLLAATVGVGLLTPLPLLVSVIGGVAGATFASLVRAVVPRRLGFLGLVPALIPLGAFVTESRLGTIPELVAGIAALALLLWCSEEPDRAPGSLARGLTGLAVPAAVFGLALASSLLLPAGLGSLGVAAGLLTVSLAAVALLLGAPRIFDQDPSATS